MPPRGRNFNRYAQMLNSECGMTREARHEAEPESEEPFYLRAQDTEEHPPSSSVSLWPLCETFLPVPVHSAFSIPCVISPMASRLRGSRFPLAQAGFSPLFPIIQHLAFSI